MYPIRGIFVGCCASTRSKENEKQYREQPKLSIHSRALFTAMDMPQRRADENHILSREKPWSVTIRLQGAVSDLIPVAGDSSFARNALQQFGCPVAS
jgi:hypothetical protein